VIGIVAFAVTLIGLGWLGLVVLRLSDEGSARESPAHAIGERRASSSGVTGFDEGRLLALSVPVVLLLALAAVSMGAALLIQSRGVDDFEQGLEGVSRLRREAHVGISRTRASSHVLEQFLDNARRSFRLQWFNHTLFVVSLVLFTAAIIDAILSNVDLGTWALGGTSLLALIVGVVTGTADKVGVHLADASQIQFAISSSTRQLSLVEEYAYKVIELRQDRLEDAGESVEEGVRQMAAVTEEALDLVQFYAEPQGDSRQPHRHLSERGSAVGRRRTPQQRHLTRRKPMGSDKLPHQGRHA
jgi:hypothetical protein